MPLKGKDGDCAHYPSHSHCCTLQPEPSFWVKMPIHLVRESGGVTHKRRENNLDRRVKPWDQIEAARMLVPSDTCFEDSNP